MNDDDNDYDLIAYCTASCQVGAGSGMIEAITQVRITVSTEQVACTLIIINCRCVFVSCFGEVLGNSNYGAMLCFCWSSDRSEFNNVHHY